VFGTAEGARKKDDVTNQLIIEQKQKEKNVKLVHGN
tara:strand:- start:132 stop:239 length:108 start_codon:yes stop_codon:yes gene_type:complete